MDDLKFSELAKYKQGTDLVVSARYETWMASNSNPVYSSEALDFIREQLALQATPRDRRGTISSSSLGSCVRKQQFTYLGMPQKPPSPKLAAVFQNGTYMHLRWQAAGLTEGWLQRAEVGVGENRYNLHGTMDGIAYDETVVEFKSCNSNSFRKVNSFGPLAGHEFQLGTYLLTTGRDKGTFIYEDKDTQEFKEIVKHRDELPLDEIRLGAEIIWTKIHDEELAEPLDECQAKTGYRYSGCPFKDNCLKVKDFQYAKEIAND